MLNKSKLWYSGLSSGGKALVIAAAVVLSGTAINVAANPSDSNQSQDAPATQTSVEEVKIETKPEVIAFAKTTVEDAKLEKGKTALRQAGENGEKLLTYEVTYKDGKEIFSKLMKEDITKQPVNEVTAIGTYVAPPPPRTPAPSSNCSPNYSGCVPIASDVDCAGGSGNGPAYARGPVTVIGSDIYDLDRDGDGVACE